jgi:uncharacterized protein DUF4314
MTTKGDRIELLHTSDEYTRLRPGDRGIVRSVREELGILKVNVDWDSGSTLALLEGVDSWRVIT